MSEKTPKDDISDVQGIFGVAVIFGAMIFYAYGVAWSAIELSRIIGESIIMGILSLATLLSIVLNNSLFNTSMKKFIWGTAIYFLVVFTAQMIF